MREFEFECRLCAHLERDGVPGGETDTIIARQLGAGSGPTAGRRVMDVVVVTPGPTFPERAAITAQTIPPAVLEGAASVGEWRPITDVIDAPPDRARAIAETATDRGFLERDRRNGTDVIRQACRYPVGWFDEVIGIENKPDLGRPGALATQLRTDASLGVFDRVVVATESYVTGVHRHRIPDPIGIWRVDFDATSPIEVVRPAEPLAVDEQGVQVLDRHPDRIDIRVATAAEKAANRRRIAERAYGTGWRPALPACAHVTATSAAGTPVLPDCAYHDRVVDPSRSCDADCPGHRPARPPRVDRRAERAARQPWVANPGGRRRSQSSLDRFA